MSQKPDMMQISREAWQELVEMPDITSPAEYPDHALITQEQLAHFMARDDFMAIQPANTAPKDGSMVRLLVDYSNGDHPLEDAKQAWTIGFNSLADTDEDEWQFVGWCWSQDCFTSGAGEIIGWQPFDTAIATDNLSQAAKDVLTERQRQRDIEGFKPEHDDAYQAGDLAQAAATYALHSTGRYVSRPLIWPWAETWWKPTSPRRDLVKAAALILAEIERLDRAAVKVGAL